MENESFNYTKLKDFFAKNAVIFVVLLVSCVYVVTGFVAIKETGKTITQIVGESLVVFLFSYFVLEAFSIQGIVKGEQTTVVVNAKKKYENLKEKLGTNLTNLSAFLLEKNEKNEVLTKTIMLCNFGLTYEKAKQGFDTSKFTKKELKSIKKILRKKTTKIFASDVLSESGKKGEILSINKNKKSYFAKRNLSNFSTKILFTIIFGYFSTAFVGFNPSEFIWKLFQVVLFLIFGLIEYFRAYLFMVGDYAENINKKTTILLEFEQKLVQGENYEK